MSHPFHYFIPGRKREDVAPGVGVRREILADLGLSHMERRFRDVSLHDCTVLGKQGVMVTPNPCEVPGFGGDKQQWLDCGKLIVGWEKDNPPGPGDLAKEMKHQVTGYAVEDVAGRSWTVPIARSTNGRETLPTDYDWDENGRPIPCRRSDCDWMWELSGDVWDYWNTDNRAAELGGESWLAETALRILQINYDLSRLELKAFRAMGGSVIDKIRAAAISLVFIDNDLAVLMDDAKKNEGTSEAA